jgi:beta-lactamase regulating signal transducer with metallopeptidase domain
MIASLMLHATALTLLLVLAAASLETSVRQQGWPVRGLWIGAALGSITLSALAHLLPERGSAAAARFVPAPVADAAAGLVWLGSQPAGVPPFRLEPWLLALWGIASAVVAVVIGISHARLGRRSREWVRQNVDGRDVWVSGDTGPAVVGVLRSRIVIPDWVLERGHGDRSLVLAHEEEHIRARDPQLLFATLLLLAALPWNLPLWWLWRRLRQAVELDCDHRVLARGLDPRAYGRLLVNVAQWGNPRRLFVTALSESPSFLERRLSLMLISRPHRWRTRTVLSTLSAFLFITAACSMGRPATAATERVTLWIAPPGTYHLQAPESAAIPQPQLGASLRTALARTGEPSVLNVRAIKGVVGYNYVMVIHAACEAGVTRIHAVHDIPAASRDVSAAPAETREVRNIEPECGQIRTTPVTRDTLPNPARGVR